MPVKVKVTPQSQSFNVLLDQTLSVKARNDSLAAFAKRQIGAADEINRRAFGAVPPKTVRVNGRENESLTNIIPPEKGVIVAEYRLIDDVLGWIMTTLRERSPIVSGDYRKGHIMLADGAEADPFNPPLAAEFTFLNTVPYARKIEIGKTESGRDFVIQVENRIYIRTGEDAKARFGNVAKIRTGFEQSSHVLKQNQASRSFAGGIRRTSLRQRSDRAAGAAISVPAIYVTIG